MRGMKCLRSIRKELQNRADCDAFTPTSRSQRVLPVSKLQQDPPDPATGPAEPDEDSFPVRGVSTGLLPPSPPLPPPEDMASTAQLRLQSATVKLGSAMRVSKSADDMRAPLSRSTTQPLKSMGSFLVNSSSGSGNGSGSGSGSNVNISNVMRNRSRAPSSINTANLQNASAQEPSSSALRSPQSNGACPQLFHPDLLELQSLSPANTHSVLSPTRSAT